MRAGQPAAGRGIAPSDPSQPRHYPGIEQAVLRLIYI